MSNAFFHILQAELNNRTGLKPRNERDKKLLQVTRQEFDNLKEAGLIKYGMDKNFTITNRYKKSAQKNYYVVEERKILKYLQDNR